MELKLKFKITTLYSYDSIEFFIISPIQLQNCKIIVYDFQNLLICFFLIKSCIPNNFYSYLFGHFLSINFFRVISVSSIKIPTRDNFSIFRSELFHLSPYYFDFAIFSKIVFILDNKKYHAKSTK